jgi:hypothetical protein
MDRGKQSEDEADVDCWHCAGLFYEDHDGEEWVRCQNILKWVNTVCGNTRKGSLCVAGVEMADTCLLGRCML